MTDSWGDALARARNLPPEGGRIELPDGTAIVVKRDGDTDARWEMVMCRVCGKRYICTPDQDYYESTTLDDGLCWDCFMSAKNLPPQVEPPYR